MTTESVVGGVVDTAQAAVQAFSSFGRDGRARLLRAAADQLESRREPIVSIGMAETSLPAARLEGELTRTVYQARLFADVLDEGSYLEATIDHAGQTPMGPGPDLRRMLVPIGPVAVFGASNFPLAFSLPGGDTVSALAAGCPVVVKIHPSHPQLSALALEAFQAAIVASGAPAGVVGAVSGRQAGLDLVTHPAIKAVGFTGSLGGGRALIDAINTRDEPIPFYGELASLNPVVVTAGAASSRGTEIADGLVAAITGSAGQLCTKPGVVFVPRGDDGDSLVSQAARNIDAASPAAMLNDDIASSFVTATESERDGVETVARGRAGQSNQARATLWSVDAADLRPELLEETFGPATLIVRYDAHDIARLIAMLPGSLTATLHTEADDGLTRELDALLQPKSGRLIYNGWPTGVLVSWAQHHGGPWPSTNSAHTSVGSSAIRRWLRPITWQNAPTHVLPDELLERPSRTAVPRRVDGHIQL